MFEIVKELTELAGPPGHEENVNSYLIDRWEPLSAESEITRLGNLVARVGGTGPKILLFAHADEIGFVVNSISDDGFLWIESWMGRLAAQPLLWECVPGQRALVLGQRGTVDGVFATVTGHLAVIRQQRETVRIDADHIFVDIGAQSREEVVDWGIRVGSPVIWNPPTRRMGELICGKAMDDRAGLAILDTLLQTLDVGRLSYDVYLASAVGEEMNVLGTRSLCRWVSPDLAIIVEIALVGDTPLVDLKDVPVRLGGGPVLVHKDCRVVYDRGITQGLEEAAQKAGVRLQDAVYNYYATDGMETVREGIRTAVLGFPTRYTHSPFETVHGDDLDEMVVVLGSFLESKPIMP